MDRPDRVKLNTWQDETVEVPAATLDKDEKVTATTRQETRRYALATLTPHNVCVPAEHSFAFVDGGRRQDGRVLVKCRKCPFDRQLIVGVHTLRDGKLIAR